MTTASAGPAVASPPDRPADRANGSGGDEKKRPRRRGWVMALTVIVTLGLLSAVAVSTGATRFLPHTGAAATPSATTAPTATIQPTATATAAPSGTATLTAQQQLDRQAANSFRTIALAKSQDGSCGSNTTAFSVGQTVYVNMCTSSHVAPGRSQSRFARWAASALYRRAGARSSPPPATTATRRSHSAQGHMTWSSRSRSTEHQPPRESSTLRWGSWSPGRTYAASVTMVTPSPPSLAAAEANDFTSGLRDNCCRIAWRSAPVPLPCSNRTNPRPASAALSR